MMVSSASVKRHFQVTEKSVSSNIIKTSTVFRAYLIKKDFNFCTLVDDAYFKVREIICRVLLILF